jgi:hypothetical protein
VKRIKGTVNTTAFGRVHFLDKNGTEIGKI